MVPNLETHPSRNGGILATMQLPEQFSLPATATIRKLWDFDKLDPNTPWGRYVNNLSDKEKAQLRSALQMLIKVNPNATLVEISELTSHPEQLLAIKNINQDRANFLQALFARIDLS